MGPDARRGDPLRSPRVLLVGVGGIGCPAALALAREGVATLGLCDDDEVDRSNLHRQILFDDADVGAPKVAAAVRALRAAVPTVDVVAHPSRLLPDNAVELVRGYDVVLEGSDNFATKFLAADACAIARVPVVHASAVRWMGTVLAVAAGGKPCYRCLFEDLPEGTAPNCAEAGVMGPVVGVVAALAVSQALLLLGGAVPDLPLARFDGKAGALRRTPLAARADCSLCGHRPRIVRIDAASYEAPACAG
jgi:adenylyltransferase/sulfurtransferase